MTAIDAVRLDHGGVVCEIAPGLGGAILSLRVNGLDLLRPAGSSVTDVHDTACFTMVPFANRIASGRVLHDGEIIDIGVDPDGAPHALHGHGWRNAWRPIASEDDGATLEFVHDGRDWPWPYRATQAVRLRPDGIEIAVTLENRHATQAMPAGVGIHPYFTRRADSGVRATAWHRWQTDETGLSTEEVDDQRFQGGRFATLDDLVGLDHFFPSRDACVTVGETVELTGSSVAGFHIYAPTDGDFFCVEPVSHVPNSFGRGEIHSGDLILPGETRSWTFSIRYVRRAGEQQEILQ